MNVCPEFAGRLASDKKENVDTTKKFLLPLETRTGGIFFLYAMVCSCQGQATFSRRFITEKMNKAASRQSTINVPQTTHNGRSPHSQEATDVR